MDNIRVFISSTYEDLREHRRQSIDAIQTLSLDWPLEWIGMEQSESLDAAVLTNSLQMVDKAHLYIGIFAMRYGTISPAHGKSVTELEYRRARERGLPCLIFLIDEKEGLISPQHVDKDHRAQMLIDLKASMRETTTGHVVSYFTTVEALAAKVTVSLVGAVKKLLSGSAKTGVRERVDSAISRGAAFIRDMEDSRTGGWNYFAAEAARPWDTAYSMMGLAASGITGVDAQFHRGQRWLIQNRCASGGWRSVWESSADVSSVIDTAAAVVALRETSYEDRPDLLAQAAESLFYQQQNDGGWPYRYHEGLCTTAATAWCIRALASSGVPPSAPALKRANEWLIAAQRPDGAWGWRAGESPSIGKTRDALMGLSLSAVPVDETVFQRAAHWLREVRQQYSTAEEFGRAGLIESHGGNQSVESVIYFVEAAYFAQIPASEAVVLKDLEWLARRRWWHYAPEAVCCLSRYRSWLPDGI